MPRTPRGGDADSGRTSQGRARRSVPQGPGRRHGWKPRGGHGESATLLPRERHAAVPGGESLDHDRRDRLHLRRRGVTGGQVRQAHAHAAGRGRERDGLQRSEDSHREDCRRGSPPD